MLIDIHRHSNNPGMADLVMRNIFHNETAKINETDFCSVGLHPWHLNNNSIQNDLKSIDEVASEKKVIAIGETGIDNAIKKDTALQKKAFEAHIEIAKGNNKPLIIHCVKAYNELIFYRKHYNHKNPWIFHWYNASPEVGFDLIDKGCYLSFGNMLFKENSKAFKTFTKVPLDRIFFETDDFEITIDEVYQKASSIRDIDLKELKNQIKKNFQTCFGIQI